MSFEAIALLLGSIHSPIYIYWGFPLERYSHKFYHILWKTSTRDEKERPNPKVKFY
jgi:hypothetical protein